MILSSPFSRQNRNLQTWTNGSSTPSSFHPHNHHSHQNLRHSNSLKKPPPEQPAPAEPKPALPAANGLNGVTSFRSHTLNRLDLQRRRLNHHQPQSLRSAPLRRNVSSLGYYPDTPRGSATDQYSSPHHTNGQIYAPASIAGTSELANYRRTPVLANGESQHYAATSFRGAASESGRSGRDSALGHLFGTLRRRTKWLRPSSSRSKSTTVSSMNGVAEPTATGGGTLPPPLQPATLDPEIYATGKRQVEADAIYAEGLSAINGNCQKRLLQYELDEAVMSEGELRTLIDERSQHQPDYKALVSTLTNWINDELAQQRIIVRDLQDDLFDGQILGKLIEKLEQIKLDIVEVTQNETTQRYKLRTVLDTINRILSTHAKWARIRWSVDGVHSKNMVEIVQLLSTLALYYRAPIKLPPNVRVMVLVVQKSKGQLVRRSHEAQLTDAAYGAADTTLSRGGGAAVPAMNSPKRDAFDALIEFAPEKLAIVKQSLVNFVNRHLNKINMSCHALDPEQFSDGLKLVFLIASLEDYFVPFGNLFTFAPPVAADESYSPSVKSETLPDMNNNTSSSLMETALEPTSYSNTLPIHKLHNVNVALQLIEETGVSVRDQVRAEDIVNGDLKSVLRVLYALFSRYKHL